MSKSINVLVVEDSENDLALLVREFKMADYELHFEWVDCANSMRRALMARSWDLIISDYTMPNFRGSDALALLKATSLDIPFIIVSGSIGEDRAVEVMREGAKDYIMKGNLKRLIPAVERELRDAVERRARREAEEQLRVTERLRNVGQVTSTIIHDLKNPMQVILSSAELLYSFDSSDEEKERYFRAISRQVERMLEMMQEILQYARGEMRLSPTVVDLADFCAEIDETFRRPLLTEKVSLVLDVPEGPEKGSEVCIFDRLKIWRAVANLIGNAKDAMPSGGEIRVSLDSTKDATSFLVQDTGTGIPEKIRESLFKPFVTHGKTHGTGLGLAIVKEIVEAHHGTIAYETGPTGTTFTITLPKTLTVTPTETTQSETKVSATT